MGTVALDESFSLRWNDYSDNLKMAFFDLRQKLDFCDLTLITDDGCLKAHQVILSACSDFFKDALLNIHARTSTPLSQPTAIFVRGVKLQELEAIIEFVYQGEVNISNDHLPEFLSLAKDFKIKGLIGHKEQQKQTFPDKNYLGTNPSTSQVLDNQTSMPTTSPSSKKRKGEFVTKKISLENSATQLICAPDAEKDNKNQLELMNQEENYEDLDTDDIFEMPDEFFQEYDEVQMTGPSVSQGIDQPMYMQEDGNPMDFLTTVRDQGQVAYRCLVCGRQSNLRHNMKKHVHRMHTVPTKNPCSVCGKVYRNSIDLDSHQRKAGCRAILSGAKKIFPSTGK